MTTHKRSHTAPWRIDDSEFYELESAREQLRFLLRYAILAPSGHNTQPWAFRITDDDGIDVYADYTRRMPVVDPKDRELLMSVGAAIMNFRVAAARFGFDVTVKYSSGRDERAPLAHIKVRETVARDEELLRLFGAIRHRHTNRAPFDDEPIEPAALSIVCEVVDQFPETLRLISVHDKHRAAELIEFATRKQMSSAAARAELADWIHPGGTDGWTGEAVGVPSLLAGSAPWLLRHIDAGPLQGPRDRERVDSAAALAVVTSESDRISLVKAGEVLERLLLAITVAGLHYSFFNQPIEQEELRDRVRMLAASKHAPQALLRIGTTRTPAPPTQRRELKEVVS